jgi:hypothetical protein
MGIGLLAVACDPIGSARLETADPGPGGQEALVVSPAVLDFGTISVLEDGSARADFTVSNAGDQTIAVHGHDEVIALEGDAEAVFEVAAEPIFELRPGESQIFSVNFVPMTDGHWEAEIQVNHGLELLRLEASATAPVAELQSSLKEAAPVGCEQSLEITLRNTGGELLQVDETHLEVGEDYRMDESLELPLVLEAGHELELPLVYAPSWTTERADTRSDVLWVDSNDPLFPSLSTSIENVAYWGSVPDESVLFAPGIETDLLFVIDSDGVMGIYTDQAQTVLGEFVDTLRQSNVDLQAAVIHHGDSCPQTSPSYTEADDPASDVLELLQDGFSAPSGWGSNALGEHAASALEHDSPGDCMDGFLREGAQLHIVLVAGSADMSSQTPEAQISALRALAPDASEIRISVLVPVSSEACSGVTLGEGYMDLAAETDGAIEDLCLDDWSGPFQAFADVSVSAQEGELIHPLATSPIVESIEVSAGGVRVDDWSWEEELGAVRFYENSSITPGEWATIRYVAAIECAE